MPRPKMTCPAGFSLIGVLIVLVIIAALTYTANRYLAGKPEDPIKNSESYIEMSRITTIDNAASSASSFLSSAILQGAEIPSPSMNNPLSGGEHWHIDLPNGSTAEFICPNNMEITIDEYNRQVQVSSGINTSKWYTYGN